MIVFLLDPAHGKETPGKRSPNGWVKEYQYSRLFISELKEELQKQNLTAQIPITKQTEIGLLARAKLYNEIPSEEKKFVVSIHLNAAGDGTEWKNAQGFEIWTSRGHTKSDDFATEIFNQIQTDFPETKMRAGTWDPKEKQTDPDKESNFTILMGANYYAVLIELAFMDNEEDFKKIINPIWRAKMIQSITKACVKIAENN